MSRKERSFKKKKLWSLQAKPVSENPLRTDFRSNFWRSHFRKLSTTIQAKAVVTAVTRFLLRMTISESPFGQYYAKYAPRTHGLPPPIPLHDIPRGREFYKRIGEPKKIVAPMVDQSELVRSLFLQILI
jgi:hypothetical protein